jgi:hypothetical protein
MQDLFRSRDLHLVEEFACFRRGRRRLEDSVGVALQQYRLNLLQLVLDPRPGLPGSKFDHALQEQRQHTRKDMGPDAIVLAMIGGRTSIPCLSLRKLASTRSRRL